MTFIFIKKIGLKIYEEFYNRTKRGMGRMSRDDYSFGELCGVKVHLNEVEYTYHEEL